MTSYRYGLHAGVEKSESVPATMYYPYAGDVTKKLPEMKVQ
jgi:hypothetical protein